MGITGAQCGATSEYCVALMRPLLGNDESAHIRCKRVPADAYKPLPLTSLEDPIVSRSSLVARSRLIDRVLQSPPISPRRPLPRGAPPAAAAASSSSSSSAAYDLFEFPSVPDDASASVADDPKACSSTSQRLSLLLMHPFIFCCCRQADSGGGGRRAFGARAPRVRRH